MLKSNKIIFFIFLFIFFSNCKKNTSSCIYEREEGVFIDANIGNKEFLFCDVGIDQSSAPYFFTNYFIEEKCSLIDTMYFRIKSGCFPNNSNEQFYINMDFIIPDSLIDTTTNGLRLINDESFINLFQLGNNSFTTQCESEGVAIVYVDASNIIWGTDIYQSNTLQDINTNPNFSFQVTKVEKPRVSLSEKDGYELLLQAYFKAILGNLNGDTMKIDGVSGLIFKHY